MWKCKSCSENVEQAFDVCWKCGTSKDGASDPTFVAESAYIPKDEIKQGTSGMKQTNAVGEKSKAFAKGGCGCIAAFLVIGLLCVLVGGHMRLDLGGAIMLFVIGGVIGLVVHAIYKRGANS